MPDYSTLLQAAKEAALAAGTLLKTQRQALSKAHQVMPHDLKTEADQAAERLIRSKLEPLGIPVIGEEYGGDTTLLFKDELYWAIDPLDGTINYMHNIPLSSVSIALMRGQTGVLGVLNLFGLDELYEGGEGLGVRRNGVEINPEYIDDTTKHILGVSDATIRDGKATELSKQCLAIRNMGACTIELAMIISARMGSYYASFSSVWDFGAAFALIRELGYKTQVAYLRNFTFQISASREKA